MQRLLWPPPGGFGSPRRKRTWAIAPWCRIKKVGLILLNGSGRGCERGLRPLRAGTSGYPPLIPRPPRAPRAVSPSRPWTRQGGLRVDPRSMAFGVGGEDPRRENDEVRRQRTCARPCFPSTSRARARENGAHHKRSSLRWSDDRWGDLVRSSLGPVGSSPPLSFRRFLGLEAGQVDNLEMQIKAKEPPLRLETCVFRTYGRTCMSSWR